jgi:hypothetical protein
VVVQIGVMTGTERHRHSRAGRRSRIPVRPNLAKI